jgi:precorrin-6B methylase 1
MARVEINQKGIDAMFALVGERLKTTTERVVRETKELPAAEAAQRLQKALPRSV